MYDLFIIGGGINGCGIAAEAAVGGLKVGLCEQYDLASGTSSASSKLIHGGLRYLEQGEFRLVQKALKEREVLMSKVPHLIQPLSFVLPHQKNLRPAWLIRLGLFLYDHLSRKNTLPNACSLDFKTHLSGQPLKDDFTRGFSYADCWVDDARLVIANARQAHRHHADILPYHRCISAKNHGSHWTLQLQHTHTQQLMEKQAKVLVNASGAWLSEVEATCLGQVSHPLLLVKGSHLIVDKFYEGNHAYILQHPDKRIVFVIPLLDQFALIGTTDVLVEDTVSRHQIDEAEIDYLLTLLGQYFSIPPTRQHIRHHFSGVRPLLASTSGASQASRDYKLVLEQHPDNAPLLTVLGGKLTTYRVLATQAIHTLQPFFPNLQVDANPSRPLPGGDLPTSLSSYIHACQQRFSQIEASLVARYVHQFGTEIDTLLTPELTMADLGTHFGGTLYQREVDYLVKHEWARSAEDILWRRTWQGLYCSTEQTAALQDHLGS